MSKQARLTRVLALIVSVTVLSWLLGAHGPAGSVEPQLAISAAVLFIALLKSRLILHEFMDVRLAPPWVRRTSDAWLGLMFVALFAIDRLVR